MKLLIFILLAVVLLVFLVGWWRTYKTQHSANQKQFLAGTVPNPLPQGFYQGVVHGYSTNWRGKTFDANAHTGANKFTYPNSTTQEKYPFRTSVGHGLRDKNVDVLKIDYGKSHPWWVRFILDEIVQTEPGHYLGKIHVRLLPGVSFAVGYFTLTQSPNGN